MSDHTPSTGAERDSGEILAAYLAGDLDEVSARSLERRLETDADLRARLDDIHDVVIRLQRVDEVEPSDDLAARVRAGVRESSRQRADTGQGGAGQGGAGQRDTEQAGTGEQQRRASTAFGPNPWWRRPVAAVAALALLGVVAISSLTLAGIGGGSDEAASVDAGATAMSAEGADDVAVPESDAQRESGAGGDGDEEAAATEAEEGSAGSDAAEAPQASAAAAPRVMMVGDLGTEAARARYLDEVRERTEVGDVLEGQSALPAPPSNQRAELEGLGLAPSCVDRLLPEDARSVQLLRTALEGVEVFGSVLADPDGTLTLRLVNPSDDCAVVLEQTQGDNG